MRMTTGTVCPDGKIEIAGDPLDTGSEVTVLSRDGNETFTVEPAEEAELLAAIDEGARGHHLPGDDVLARLRRGS